MKKTTENQPIFLAARPRGRGDRAQRIAAAVLGAAAAVMAVCTALHYVRAGHSEPLILQRADFSAALYEPARLDLNTADAAALEELPGIGPVLAGRIVEYRREHGLFKTRDDVLDVYGIGEATYEKIEPYITY